MLVQKNITDQKTTFKFSTNLTKKIHYRRELVLPQITKIISGQKTKMQKKTKLRD